MPDTVGPNKAIAAGAAGGATIVLVWLLHQFAHVEMPAEVASAFTTLVAALVTWAVPHGGAA